MCFVLRFPGGKAKVFTMSYDDGTFADYRLIEIMNKNKIKGTFNINGDKISPVDANGKTKGRLSVKQINELYLPNGHEIALHTLTHPTLVDLPVERVTYEYLKDKEILEEITGEIIRGSAYPNSAYNDKVIEALKAAGVSYARGGDQTESFALPKDWHKVMPTVRHTNEKLFKLGEEFLTRKHAGHHLPIMFYLMGHSYEFNLDNNWDRIESFLEMMGGKDDIWYATNIEIYDYIEAFKRVRFNLACTFAENPTSTDVWISKDNGIHKLEAGKRTYID